MNSLYSKNADYFLKNFGLYGDRVGILSLIAEDQHEAARITSQLKLLIRPMYSNPPLHGARIVACILGNDRLTNLWREECRGMAVR